MDSKNKMEKGRGNNKKKDLFADDEEEQQPEAGHAQQAQAGKMVAEVLGQGNQECQGIVDSFSAYEGQLLPEILSALEKMQYTKPTRIQSLSLQHSLKEGDMACLSETGSGKTLSFLLPVINKLCQVHEEKGGSIRELGGFCLILAPTRELCTQIQEYLVRFKGLGIKACTSVVLHGGSDTKMKQILELTKKPAVIVGTPGRVLDHLQNTKGFSLNGLKYLVLDEADKLLHLDFEQQINTILELIPPERTAYLYSATLTSRVEKLQRVSLRSPTRIEVNAKYKTVAQLDEAFLFIPSKWKDCYLVYVLNRLRKTRAMVFVKTCLGAERLFLVLREVGLSVDCLHGDLSQPQRDRALENFRAGNCQVLVCTDVASRGIDVAGIELVVNYDICGAKDYIHRVGRTARIGLRGMAISIVTQYDVEMFQEMERKLGKKIREFEAEQPEALVFLELLDRCHQEVSRKMRTASKKSH